MRQRLMIAASFILALALVACADEASAPTDGDDDLGPSSPDASDGRAPQPTLGEGVEEIGSRGITIAISPGVPYNLTPYDVQVGAGGEPPPCDKFVFAFGWQVVNPFEPPPEFALSWTFTSGAETTVVGSGPSGVAEVGCGTLTATNNSDQEASLAVQYVVGEKP